MGDFFAQPQNKPDRAVGRPGGQGGDGSQGQDAAVSSPQVNFNGQAAGYTNSPRKAGVVIHATVEHMGLVGDTELTVKVNWPASTFCVPACGKPAAQTSPGQDVQQVPENGPLAPLHRLASADAGAVKKNQADASSKHQADASSKHQADASSKDKKEGDQCTENESS
jgi:hypothetical protein